MKNFLRGLLIVMAVLPLEANPIEATFVGVNGAEGFGYYVGPYYGKLEQQSVVLDCVDFANEVYFGEQWAVNLSPIETQQDLANTRYGGLTDALQLYQEAAWLTEQYAINPASDYADIQATIWQLFDPFAPSPSSGYWLNLARTNYAGGNYANFFVVTNVGPVNPTGQEQEFLTVLNPSMSIYPQFSPPSQTNDLATPEPALLGVLGLVMMGLAGLLRWWRKRFP
jgi:hypothetical protein